MKFLIVGNKLHGKENVYVPSNNISLIGVEKNYLGEFTQYSVYVNSGGYRFYLPFEFHNLAEADAYVKTTIANLDSECYDPMDEGVAWFENDTAEWESHTSKELIEKFYKLKLESTKEKKQEEI